MNLIYISIRRKHKITFNSFSKGYLIYVLLKKIENMMSKRKLKIPNG